jgi:lysophospholipid acyltransferase (LPLAT)-like uncharacterized protein
MTCCTDISYFGGVLIIKLFSFTYKVKIVDSKNERDLLENEKSLIYAGWHQWLFPGITFFAKRKPIAIMISRSRDGEFISRIVRFFGWYPIGGSSSRGGGKAFRKMRELTQHRYKIAHIVDGPKGPPGVVKPGVVRIAHATGIPILPTSTSPQEKWVFNSWDRFMIPKPFSRVIIKFGNAIYVEPGQDKNELEKKRSLIQQKLEELNKDTDLIWTQPVKIKEIFSRKG